MTFGDDYIQIEFSGGTKRYFCVQAGLSWPPPEKISFMGFKLKRMSYSIISDEDRAKMEFVARGALYHPDET